MPEQFSELDDGDIVPKPDLRRERGKSRQSVVLDTARALFIERGYRGTTLEAIIARAGGSRRVIYGAFGGKRGLLGALIAQAGDPISAMLGQQNAEMPPRQALRAFALGLVQFWTSPEGRAMNRMAFAEGMEEPEIVEVCYRNALNPAIEALTKFLERQHARGALEIRDPEITARQFLLLLMAETAFNAIPGEVQPATFEVMVDRLLDLFLGRLPDEGQTPDNGLGTGKITVKK